MKKITLIWGLLLTTLFVNAQEKNNLQQIQGVWKTMNDEGAVITIVRIVDNFWCKVDFDRKNNALWIRDITSLDTSIFHFIDHCPDRYSNATYKIEDTLNNSTCFMIYPKGIHSLCYDISLNNNQFSLQWSERAKNIFDYYRMNMKKVQTERCRIYNAQKEPTKMYLIKGDQVEGIKEEGNWIEIKYYGQRIIEGWIPKGSLN